MENIDWDNGELLIYEQKTGKERKVFMGEAGKAYLKLYVGNVRENVCYGQNPGGMVFASIRDGKVIANGTVNIHLREFCRRAGIKKHVSCHCFRHSFGTHLLENGVSLKMVSELLGHDSLGSTEKYTRLYPEHLRQTILKYHPREAS